MIAADGRRALCRLSRLHYHRPLSLPCFHRQRFRSFNSTAIPHINPPSFHKFAKDQVFIDSLSLKCTVGPDALGLINPQPVSLSVSLSTSVARAAASDRTDLSIDYQELTNRILEIGDDECFSSVAELVDRVIDHSLLTEGVGKACVKVDLHKGLLRAKNIQWEKIAWMDNGVKGEWKCTIEGVEVPVIIGIVEHQFERIQKQIVSIDLGWHGCEGDSTALESFPTTTIVNSIIKVLLLYQC